MKKPKIVCLCGSTRFKKEYEQATLDYTLRGYIVLSVGCFSHADKYVLSEQQKIELDKLHLRKIDLADEVFIVNKNGYIGDSTRYEILYAKDCDILVKYLEPIKK